MEGPGVRKRKGWSSMKAWDRQPQRAGAALRTAHRTLARATDFLGNGLSAQPMREGPLPIVGPHRAKVIGNSLRELDGFLNLLIDEIARSVLPADEQVAFRRLRNTPNKLQAVRAAMAMPSPDHARLRAIGRSRDCLFHCGGIVRRGDGRGESTMTPGWFLSDRRGPRLAMGDTLYIGRHHLAELCAFYDAVVADLLGIFDRHRSVD